MGRWMRVALLTWVIAAACANGGSARFGPEAPTRKPGAEPVDQAIVRAMAWCGLAYGHLAVGDLGRARQAALELIRARRRAPDGYALVGDLYAAEGDWNNAWRYYAEAWKRAPDSAPLRARTNRARREASLGPLPVDAHARGPARGVDPCVHYPGCSEGETD